MTTADRLIQLAGGHQAVGSLLDVGAFHGRFSLEAAARYPHIRFLAIEPVPELATELQAMAGELPNYEVINVAAGASAGKADLYVPSGGRYNFSSLLPMRPDRVSNRDVELDSSIEVRVEPLEAIVDVPERSGNLVVKVDTQGTEVAALRSLGCQLARVRAGMMETAINHKTVLYKDGSTRADAVRFLRGAGFEVVSVAPEASDAQNLVFVNRVALSGHVALWRLAYPVLILVAWCRWQYVRLHVALGVRTRIRRMLDARVRDSAQSRGGSSE